MDGKKVHLTSKQVKQVKQVKQENWVAKDWMDAKKVHSKAPASSLLLLSFLALLVH